MLREINFDGIVGPTHHFGGLSFGNIASTKHAAEVANPKKAALEGLDKMAMLHQLGAEQAVLPPQQRPHEPLLAQMGFSGSLQQQLERCYAYQPSLLSALFSASSMWSANAATVSPSVDTQDGKLHITPANLINKFHRSCEANQTFDTLQAIFSDTKHFTVHQPLPNHPLFSDEGAANHGRFTLNQHQFGIELFVYGIDNLKPDLAPAQFPARQTRQASEAIARLHTLPPERYHFIQQHPHAIDCGAFHNDVVSVSHDNLLFYHECAFVEPKQSLQKLQQKMVDTELIALCVPEAEVALQAAIDSYLFNSQIINSGNGYTLICPEQCRTIAPVKRYIERLTEISPINSAHYVDLTQSMQNGGGPACLRLRVAVTDSEHRALNQGVLYSEALHTTLTKWIEKHYRDRLTVDDFRSSDIVTESQQALDELTQILQLGSIYPFQR